MTDALLPPGVLKNVGDVDQALRGVEEHLRTVIPNCTRENLQQLTPLERASTIFALSKTLNSLFGLYLRTSGLSPDEHASKSESDRVALYQEKLQDALDKSTAPSRPTSTLDISAANRFIEHSISDLTEDQRKQVREIGKQAGVKRRNPMLFSPKKRPSGLSIADEAAAFLAEASKEIQIEQEKVPSKLSVAEEAAAFLEETSKELQNMQRDVAGLPVEK